MVIIWNLVIPIAQYSLMQILLSNGELFSLMSLFYFCRIKELFFKDMIIDKLYKIFSYHSI